MPMMKERLKILTEVGRKLSESYEGDWINFINAGPKKLYYKGEGLIERLISEFPRFDDTSKYNKDIDIHFYKLAQLGKLVKMGNVKAAAKAIKPAIDSLIKMKCKKIILGCTELPIAIFAFKSFKNVKSSKVFLDPNLILAHSAMVKHKN